MVNPIKYKIGTNLMNFINGFKAKTKQSDKVRIEFRISKLTLLKLDLDWSRKTYEIIFFNFGFKNNK